MPRVDMGGMYSKRPIEPIEEEKRCPHCYAPKGARCTTATGTIWRAPHKDRR